MLNEDAVIIEEANGLLNNYVKEKKGKTDTVVESSAANGNLIW